MKKYCPDDQNEQHFFIYFLNLSAVFEEIAAEMVGCSILGADELMMGVVLHVHQCTCIPNLPYCGSGYMYMYIVCFSHFHGNIL